MQLWSLGRLNLMTGHERVVHEAMNWANNNLSRFSPEELLTMGNVSALEWREVEAVAVAMGLAMLESLGLEDLRIIAEAFHGIAAEDMLDVHIDQFIALTLLFPPEHRQSLHETAFGSEAAPSILLSHQDRQAQITVQSTLHLHQASQSSS